MTTTPSAPVSITAADIETWARVECAIKGKAMELCAAHCDHPPRPCRPCIGGHDPDLRQRAFTLIRGGLAPSG